MGDLRYFFTYGDELPPNVGFSLFGTGHLLWIFMIVIGTVFFLKWYSKQEIETKSRAEQGIGLALAGLIVLRTIYVAWAGKMSVYELPLHLCSMAGILCGVHGFLKWDWLGQVLYSLCLPGTILALMFPDWAYYPVIHFITIEGFLFHAGIVMYVSCQLHSYKIVPNVKRCWKVLLFLIVVMPLIYWFDKRFNANYMFVNSPSAGSPLEWLADVMGVPGYLWGYAAFIVAGIILMDLGYQKYAAKGYPKA